MAELKGDAMLFTDVPEIADIPLTPLEFKYVTAYLSPECNMDMHKAYRMVLTDEAFKSMHRTTFYTQARQMAGREMVRKAISRLMTKAASITGQNSRRTFQASDQNQCLRRASSQGRSEARSRVGSAST